MQLSENARALFAKPVFAHVAVVDAKGAPHVTPVWVDVNADGELWFNTAVGRVKDKCLPEGAPVAISVTDPENGYSYLQVRGTVAKRITETGDADIDHLAKKYMGVDSYPLRQPGEQRVTIVVAPTSTTGEA
ncbi:MAG: PPOX class F420-dependent oxidoreductase [Acidimicrobiia bacterium]